VRGFHSAEGISATAGESFLLYLPGKDLTNVLRSIIRKITESEFHERPPRLDSDGLSFFAHSSPTSITGALRMTEPRDRIIFAMDVGHFGDAQRFVRLLKDRVGMFKIGKQLFTHAGPKVLDMIQQMGQRTFLDLKFHDIPNTVARASEEATRLSVTMFNVHAMGGLEMMKAAVQAARRTAKELGVHRPTVLAVTVLTSLNHQALKELGIQNTVDKQVARLAQLAEKGGLDGVVASPREINLIRKTCGKDFVIVCQNFFNFWISSFLI